jgi:hypothetical protein
MKNKTMDTNMYKFRRIAVWLVCLLGAGTSHAVPMLEFQPSAASVTVGGSTSVDVMLSGLVDEYIGSYDLTIDWDAAVLSLQGVVFDIYLDGPADSIAGSSGAAGSVNVYEVSLGTLANQTGSGALRLFSLNFDAIGAGLSSLSFSSVLLGDATGASFDGFEASSGSIEVEERPAPVPESGSLLMLGLGLAALALSRRQQTQARGRTSGN